MEFRDERGSARNSSMIDSHTQFSGRHSFAIFRLAGNEVSAALYSVAASSWHQPSRGTAPKTPPRYFL